MKAMIFKTVFLLTLILLATGNSWSQTPEQQFQKGIMKEEGEGSLKEAIDLYKSVADNTKADKVLRAKALYQMGACYEKLGQQEARIVYEKLVANYTDPQELVANAKRKLNTLNAGQSVLPKSGLSMRQIMDSSDKEGPFSPDGKFVVYYDWDSVLIGVRNLETGEKWPISKKGKWGPTEDQYPDVVIWAPDSKYLAYCWTIQIDNYSKYSAEIHIVKRDGSEDQIIGKDTVYYIPFDWSSDGKNLLCARWGDPVKLSLLTLNDGDEKEIANLGHNRFPYGAQFSDDGNFVVFSAQKEEKSQNYDIYSVPVNGGTVEELVNFKEKEEVPGIIRGTNKIVFISSHSGEKALWAFNIENGKLKGNPEILKDNLDVSSRINSVLDNGTVLISSHRLNPEFFYAKLNFEKNTITWFPFNIARDASLKIVKTIWSPSLNKVAVLAADPMISVGFIGMKFIGYDLKTGKKTEIPSELRTFPLQDWIDPQWTPDEKSVLIKAQTIDFDKKPRGIFKFDFSTGQVEEYMTKEQAWTGLHWKWLQFSPNGKAQYFASLDSNFNYPVRIIERSVENGTEKEIIQFDKEIKKFCLSPDGKSIAVKYENALQIIPVDNPSEVKKIEGLDENWGTLLGWTSDCKSVLVQKPVDKKSWSIWRQTVDGKEYGEVISADKLKPFFGASGLMLHYVGGETYLSMQNGERIYELWAVDNIVQK